VIVHVRECEPPVGDVRLQPCDRVVIDVDADIKPDVEPKIDDRPRKTHAAAEVKNALSGKRIPAQALGHALQQMVARNLRRIAGHIECVELERRIDERKRMPRRIVDEFQIPLRRHVTIVHANLLLARKPPDENHSITSLLTNEIADCSSQNRHSAGSHPVP
jgi:hypothetical protein